MTFDEQKDKMRDQISIHMPHTWHDDNAVVNALQNNISIHMPHTWHDL